MNHYLLNKIHFKLILLTGIILSCILIGQLHINEKNNLIIDALFWSGSIITSAYVFKMFKPKKIHLGTFLVVLMYLTFGVGIIEVATVLFWLFSSWCTGLMFFLLLGEAKTLKSSLTSNLVLGVTFWVAVWGVMIHFQINFREVFLVIGFLPLILFKSHYLDLKSKIQNEYQNALLWIESIPIWSWVLGLIIIGWVLRWAFFPTVSYDDHALHLRIWHELLANKQYSFDIKSQIWASAPFTVDLIHAVLSIMSGSDIRSAMNLSMAVLIFLLMIKIFQRFKIEPQIQLLLIVLMASTPMLGNLLLTLHTELMLSVIVLAGFVLLLELEHDWCINKIIGILACAALCASIKLPGIILSSMLIIAMLLQYLLNRKTNNFQKITRLWPLILIIVILIFVALHAYVTAFYITGNPVFPLYNGIFLSPFFPPENFSHLTYVHGFNLNTYVSAFFHTSKFFESGDNVAGWQYLLLLPLAIFAALKFKNISFKLALIIIFGYGLLIFSTTQYWRYLFPVMPLVGVLFAALFFHKNQILKKILILIVLSCIGANIYFFKNVSWVMKSPAGLAITNDGKINILKKYVPSALLTETINKLMPGANVLYPFQNPAGATLHGNPLYVNWYSPFREKTFQLIKNSNDIEEFVKNEKVQVIIYNMLETGTKNEPKVLLREYLANYGLLIDTEQYLTAYKVSTKPIVYKKLFDLNASKMGTISEVEYLYPKEELDIFAVNAPRMIAIFPTLGANQARYKAQFNCPSENGFFIAQINWDIGPPFYRFISCKEKNVNFAEALLIPKGASKGRIFITAKGINLINVKQITIEINL